MADGISRAERRRLKRERSKNKLESYKEAKKSRVFVIWGLLIFLLVAFVLWYMNRPAPLPNNEMRVSAMSQDHVASTEDVEYNSNPPTSGPHFTDWHKDWKFYDSELPMGGMLHNMEHGGVVVFFQPDLDEATKELLKEFTEDNFKVIAGTNADIPSPIAMAAWGVYELFEDFDGAAMKAFYKRNLNNSPENVYP